MAAPRRKPASKKTTEARLIGLASFILERGGAASREAIYEDFPDEYTRNKLAKERSPRAARTRFTASVPGAHGTARQPLRGVVLGYGGEATIEGPGDVEAGLRQRIERLRSVHDDEGGARVRSRAVDR